MKTTVKITMSICFAACFVFALEPAPPEHVALMKKFGAAQKGAAADAAKAGAEIEATAKEVGAWWAKRNDEVAAKAVAQVIEGAQALQKGDQAGMQTVNNGCRTCHTAHRDMPNGIK